MFKRKILASLTYLIPDHWHVVHTSTCGTEASSLVAHLTGNAFPASSLEALEDTT